MGLWKRVIVYVFPVYLIAVESGLRFIMIHPTGASHDVKFASAASAICATGISLMAPLLIPKPIVVTPEVAAMLAPYGSMLRPGDLSLMLMAMAAILVATLSWGAVLWMVQNSFTSYDPIIQGKQIPLPLMIALAIYIAGLVLTEIKEAV